MKYDLLSAHPTVQNLIHFSFFFPEVKPWQEPRQLYAGAVSKMWIVLDTPHWAQGLG